MKVAITGATGFVGSHLETRLTSEGHEVVRIARRAHDDATVQSNLLDVKQLIAAFVAQIRILSEGVVGPGSPVVPVPYDLLPTRRFTAEQIRNGLPHPGPFCAGDLRWCS